jgi:hypothetical protein
MGDGSVASMSMKIRGKVPRERIEVIALKFASFNKAQRSIIIGGKGDSLTGRRGVPKGLFLPGRGGLGGSLG